MSSLSRNGLIGLGIGVTVSTGVIALLVFREMWRRRKERRVAVSCGTAGFALIGATPDGRKKNPGNEGGVAELRNSLKDIANTIIEDVRKGVEEGQRSRRRRHFLTRERSDSMSSSSVYFTASNGMSGGSEGGYTTAYSTADSDYTDRETDRDEDQDEDDKDEEEEEEEERSSATVLTLQPDESRSEEDDVSADEGAETRMSPELTQLLTQSDILHAGDSEEKTEGFQLLRRNTPLEVNLSGMEAGLSGVEVELQALIDDSAA
ncbi:Regulator of microtubule dynamics protein 3 [Bagarius yarrelli]|uniref:Regulator of microtubule dynamics protein 3 n=1 Tax=Bagarius yarrelli TaxID=175774 RepID=A0A556VWB2_BAGYA|nr:Regulator of microtubule dynamics protein 3 [Bagarius yarrelli]